MFVCPQHRYACYIGIGVMVALVIPFSIFYYEADSELCADSCKRGCTCTAIHQAMPHLIVPWSPDTSFVRSLPCCRSAGKRVVSACIWAGLTMFVFAIVFGLAYGALSITQT